MSKWSEFKKNQGETRPWHLINPGMHVKDPKIAEDRLAICKACPELVKVTKQCLKCGCIMPAKVKLEAAKCPLGKW